MAWPRRLACALSFGVFLTPAPTSAQEWRDRGGLYVFVDTEVESAIRWPALDRLFLSYGAAFFQYAPTRTVTREEEEGTITTEFTADPATLLPPLTPDRAVRVGGGFYVATLYGEVAFQNFDGATSAELEGGVATVYETVGRAWTFDVGLLVPVGPLEVGGGLGMLNTRGQLRASTHYPDGTVSYGDDNFLNGVWTLNGMTLTANARALLRLGPVGVYGRAEWLNPADLGGQFMTTGVVQESYGQRPMIDSDTYTFIDPLPTSVASFDGRLLNEAEERVVEVFDGFRGTVGLVFILGG